MAVKIYKAEQDDGTVLWPEERSQEWLNRVKSIMPPSMFNAQYNNDPSGLRGVRYDITWLHYYFDSTLPPLTEMIGFQGGDPATTKNESSDFFGHVTVGRHTSTGRIYVLDMIATRLTAPEHLSFLEAQARIWRNRGLRIQKVRLEALGPLQATTQNIMEQTRTSQNLPIEAYPEKGVRAGSKEERFDSIIPYLSNGTVLFPGIKLTDGNEVMIKLPGFQEFVTEFTQFPRSAHDDVLDALHLVIDMAVQGSIPVEISDDNISTDIDSSVDNFTQLSSVHLSQYDRLLHLAKLLEDLRGTPVYKEVRTSTDSTARSRLHRMYQERLSSRHRSY